MKYTSTYASPLGKLLLASDGEAISGIWFDGQAHFARGLALNSERRELCLFTEMKCWFDIYFGGDIPDFTPRFSYTGTAFQKEVWQILTLIPYGTVITYGEIAQRIAASRGTPNMHISPRAVGSAIGKNPLSILVPCHRVIGADGAITGYAGGIARKRALLELEVIKLK